MFHERASAMMLSLVMFTQEARVQHVQRLSAKMVAEFDIEIDHPIRGFASLGHLKMYVGPQLQWFGRLQWQYSSSVSLALGS
jgi:hypothetical protein